MRILVHVLGCRSSLYEGEFIAEKLKTLGHEIVNDLHEDFNAAVIVTCSVTGEADKKCRQIIRRARRVLKNGALAVCGCWAEKIDTAQAQELGINILTGTRNKNLLPEILDALLKNPDSEKFIDLRNDNQDFSKWEELGIKKPVLHSRAFIKIQDGCNHFCTYCIIPFLRGRPVSRPLENIISEIKNVIANGVQEIILTGIHLGIYGRDLNLTLADLINELAKLKNIPRLRLGSLEPFSLDVNLMTALKNCESFCHHLHLPLQSGDDGILKSMRRGYSSSDFIKICELSRKIIDEDLHISSDILTGFPGESDIAFENTLKTMREAGLGRVHVFSYSERDGTLAAKFPDKVPDQIKAFRKTQAIKLGDELLKNYAVKFIGRNVKILAENDFKGYTENYIEAHSQNLEHNKIYTLKALNFEKEYLICSSR